MKPLIILTGPTAVGKTALSIALAKEINGEIISADSMQVYRKMNIGTAKVTPEEMQGVKHYLIDVLDPSEEFNVFLFQKLAKEAMETIYAKGKIPVIAGGTGFYIQSVLYDIDFSKEPDAPSAFREEMYELAEKQGPHAVYERLLAVDPEYAKSVHENNVKRVVRALEYHMQTGRKMSEHNMEQRQKPSPYNFLYFVLNDDRDKIYKRIDERVDKMLEQGLLSEVKALMEDGCKKEFISMQGLGYKEFFDYFEGNCTLEEAVYTLKRDTRHFAKRQLTWFGREKDVTMINYPAFHNDRQEILSYMINLMKEKGILQ